MSKDLVESIRTEFQKRFDSLSDKNASVFAILFDTLSEKQPYFGLITLSCPLMQSVARRIAENFIGINLPSLVIEVLFLLYEGVGKSPSTYLGKTSVLDLYIRFAMSAASLLSENFSFCNDLVKRRGKNLEHFSKSELRSLILMVIVEEDMLDKLCQSGFFIRLPMTTKKRTCTARRCSNRQLTPCLA